MPRHTRSANHPKSKRRGQVLLPLLAGVVTLGTVGLVSWSSLSGSESTSTTAPLFSYLPPTGPELAVAMARAGLTPEALAAVGVASNDIDDVVADARTEYDGATHASLTTLDTDIRTARAAHRELARDIRSGQSDDTAGLATLASDLATYEGQRDTILADLYEAATADLTNDQKTLLASFKANEDCTAPIALKWKSRTDADWVAIRTGLAHERMVAKGIDEQDDDLLTTLNAARNEPTSSTCQGRVTASCAACTTAFYDACGE